MKKLSFILFISFVCQISFAQNLSNYNLTFDKLANKWDEAIPLGNGMLGVLVWGKGNQLRLSIDRADLWDERNALPDISTYNFKWVQDQVAKKQYNIVQQKLDYPYDNQTYPTKLPAGAIEFNISSFGKVVSNVLDIKTAINTIKFENGVVFNCFIHASQNKGSFSFNHLENNSALPQLMVHNYASNEKINNDNSHAGAGLQKLGYAKGSVKTTVNSIRYQQPIYDGRYYEILIKWIKTGNKITGNWTISNNEPAVLTAVNLTQEITSLKSHKAWWTNFWSKSAITIPDEMVQKQYYLDMYKLGAVARKGAPAITLQAVWTADNGSLPPWKGDFHNDLNTQLSYWPTYTGNRLAEGKTFTDWLWKVKAESEKYTKSYFGVAGLNIPGVVTFSGKPMGGWIQYSMSPTVGAWCSQHFYWQWKYSMDKKFLDEQAYTYITQSAIFLENITFLKDGVRMLPLSSSPEFNDNDITAWFKKWSNFDLGLAKFLFNAANEVSVAKGDKKGAAHWQKIVNQLPDFEANETGFTVAPGLNLLSSHRHMSQYMGIYPLALLDYNKPEDKIRIDNSFKQIEAKGTSAWCGYSFSWMASLYARAYQADKSLKQLQIFASNFCSPNSFHLNGDQKGGEHSNFTYRPFTLEGNFAFAQGVHELLLQSRNGYVEVFPAIPTNWNDCSFKKLRTEGAFLITANYVGGKTNRIVILSEKGEKLNIKLPKGDFTLLGRNLNNLNGTVSLTTKIGETLIFISKN